MATPSNPSFAPPGIIGEVVSSSILSGNAVSLSTGVPANITSIILKAGDWNVCGRIGFVLNALTAVTSTSVSINTTSATLALGSDVSGTICSLPISLAVGSSPILNVGYFPVSINSDTTFYLITSVDFSVSTASAYGVIWARRKG